MTCSALKIFNPEYVSQNAYILNSTYEISFSLQRIYKNILIINSGINSKTIYASNTTLMAIAAEEYQDGSLWTYLAQVNNLQDFLIDIPRYIIIPPKSSAVSFGT